MKRAFWIGGAVGLVVQYLLFIPIQILPSRLWYVLMPAGLAESTLYIALHRGIPVPLPIWEKILCLIVGFGGDFLIYGLLACAVWRFRSRQPVAQD
ncbi:MAG: hypothetical protein WDM87_03005 [Terracidiphilus sp.]